MKVSEKLISGWRKATDSLPAGVQHAIHDALSLCAEDKIRLAFGADSHVGVPCLINSVSNTTTQQKDSPISYAREVVVYFDLICESIQPGPTYYKGNLVDPITAEFLLRNMGELKPIVITSIPADFAECAGVTFDDEACLNSWIASSIRGLDVDPEVVDPEVVETVFNDGTP